MQQVKIVGAVDDAVACRQNRDLEKDRTLGF